MRDLIKRSRLTALMLLGTVALLSAGVLVATLGLGSGKSESPFPPETEQILELERQWEEAAAKITPVPLNFEDGPFHPFGTPGTPRALPPSAPGLAAGDGEIIDDFAKSDWICCFAENLWVATLGDRSITLMAGSLLGDDAQGAVVITVRDAYGDYLPDVRSGLHLTQKKEGRLRVVGGSGMDVYLESEAGGEYVFDAEEGRFVSPFVEPLSTPTPTATPTPSGTALSAAGLVAVDVVTSDRDADDALGSRPIESCREASVGESFAVDVVVEGLPADGDGAIGITGFEFRIAYDSDRLVIAEVDTSMLLAANDDSAVFDVSEPPSTGAAAGVLTVGALDISESKLESAESDGGVLVRLTVQVKSAGTSEIRVLDGALVDTYSRPAPFDQTASAMIAVGSECS